MIDQRFYNSATTTRSMNMEMGPIPLRSHTQNIYKEQQKQLQRSLSRQSHELSKSKKNLHRNMSRQNDMESLSRGHKNAGEVNQILEAYGEGRIQDIESENICLNKFQFKFLSYLAEVVLAYGITIGLMYASQSTSFPFFLVLCMFGLMFSIMPWAKTNIILMISCAAIVANFYLNIQVLTYPIILIFYFAVVIFNQHNKIKLLFIPILVITMVWGFIVIPALYAEFVRIGNNKEFYYIFPLFMYIIRVILYMVYRHIHYTEYIFLQLPFFLTGIQFGVMLTLNVGDIEFWYLMVFFTLLIINDRTQFTVNILIALSKALSVIGERKEKSKKKKKQPSQSQENLDENGKQEQENIQKDVTILASHASGYSSVHFMHIICMVYVFTMLKVSTPPYVKGTLLNVYVQNKQYLPVVIWGLGIVYEFMCLVLERKRKDKLLIGFTNNGILHTIQRGFMLSVGLWMFYLGLGVGNYSIIGRNI